MNTYEVIGYTATGLYSEIVEATSALTALVKGRRIIRKWMPAKRWLYWHAQPY